MDTDHRTFHQDFPIDHVSGPACFLPLQLPPPYMVLAHVRESAAQKHFNSASLWQAEKANRQMSQAEPTNTGQP